MPPKRKSKKGKKNKKVDVNLEEDKFKRTQKEIVLVKDKLAVQMNISRRATSAASTARQGLIAKEDELLQMKQHEKDISAELTRQYKTMHTDLSIQNTQLEAQVSYLNQQLSHTNNELENYKIKFDSMLEEKNNKILQLQTKIDGMEGCYERVLTEALDSLVEKICKSSLKWDGISYEFQKNSKETLASFGLNHHDI